MGTNRSQRESILLVEDDSNELTRLKRCFDGQAFDLWEAGSVKAALDVVERHHPSLVISEIVLPDASGFSLCRLLRENPSAQAIPVVLMSRWVTEGDRILAFHCGADDFVAKPFFPRELTSRMRAVLRRSRNPTVHPHLPRRTAVDSPGIKVEEHGVRVGGRFIDLTPREHGLLVALLERQGRVMKRAELIEEVWRDEEPPNARNVDAHVKSLRRKLGPFSDSIETVRGIGYRFTIKTHAEQRESA